MTPKHITKRAAQSYATGLRPDLIQVEARAPHISSTVGKLTVLWGGQNFPL